MIDKHEQKESWESFWNQEKPPTLCLAGAPGEALALIEEHWADIARPLTSGTHVVDLACGNGVAGAMLNKANNALKVSGVELSRLPQTPTHPIRIYDNTSTTKMPFPDKRTGFFISQFGIEYTPIAETAKEMTRIADEGAHGSFLVHHGDSIIVENGRHRARLLSLMIESAIWGAAATLDTHRLQTLFNAWIRQYGEDPLILEIASALKHFLSLNNSMRKEQIESLKTAMMTEHMILTFLQDKAVNSDQLTRWQKSFGKELQWHKETILRHNGDILCWKMNFQIHK